MKRRTLAAFLLAATGLCALPASAQTKWDFFTSLGVNHPVTLLLGQFAEEVKKRSNGELLITLRPAGELPFKPGEVVKITSEGQVQLGEALTVFITGTVPLTGVTALPMLLRSEAEMNKAMPIIQKYVQKDFEKVGIRPIFHFSWPLTSLYGSGKPVRSLADFNGRKFRTISPQQAELLKRLGAASVSLTTAEVSVALERNTVEGVMTTAHTLESQKWDEFLKWGFMADFHGADDFVLVNIEAYNKLSPGARRALDEVAREWGPKMTRASFANEAKSQEQVRGARKIELIQMSKADTDALTARMKDYWVSWAQQTGPTAVAMLQEIRAAVGK